MLSLIKVLIGPSRKATLAYVKDLIVRLNHCYDESDAKQYLALLMELEDCLQYLPLSKTIKLGHDLGGLSITTADCPFNHWLFYLAGYGGNVTLIVDIKVGIKHHRLFIDRYIS